MYPLVPKSTKALRPGQFWAIPLPDGGFACGRVLQIGGSEIPTKSRGFFGGLHQWRGNSEPKSSDLIGNPITDYGVMHIKSITELGGKILGELPTGIELPTQLSAHGGPETMLLNGADALREAQRSEWGQFPVLGFWGYDFIEQLACRAPSAA